jgi:glyoxylase-like metal-dependent hydrolase (beta-lactamase superfamily II)
MQLPVWVPGIGHVNMYGLLDDRGLAVVDPGLPGPTSWRALKRRLKTAGFRLRDIHSVVVTHSHPDHFGGAGRLRHEVGADIITHRAFSTAAFRFRRGGTRASEQEQLDAEHAAAAAAETFGVSEEAIPTVAEYLDDFAGDPLRDDPSVEMHAKVLPWDEPAPWGGPKPPAPKLSRRVARHAMRVLFTPPDPTRRVRHAERVRLAGREWVGLHTPGHTIDHLCLFDPEHGLLFSGDHVLPTITPHVSGVHDGADALHSYLQTLDLVGALEGVELGLPAHGHPFRDVRGRVDAIKQHHAERSELLVEISGALGPATVQALTREMFPEKHWSKMAESETFAHLQHLLMLGRAERWTDDGMYVYRLNAA